MPDIEQIDATQGAGEELYKGFAKVNQIITKINAIEAGATQDQSGAEIKALLEALIDKLSIAAVKETDTKKVLTAAERANIVANVADIVTAQADIITAQAAADAAQADIDGFPDELKNLITHEIEQLENIPDDLDISAAQWGYLGAMNQGVVIGSIPAFLFQKADQNNIAVNADVTVIFDVERFDIGDNFAGNTFTAPVTGKYHFDVHLRLKAVDSAADSYRVDLMTSNRTFHLYMDPRQYAGDVLLGLPITLSVVADLDEDDTAYVSILQDGGAQQTDIADDSWFSGVLVG